MNVQPKLSHDDDRTMASPAPSKEHLAQQGRHGVPAGPRAFVTWPVEFEVEPWRP